MATTGHSDIGDVVEEQVVCIDFCAPIDTNLLDSKSIKLLGLDDNEVILQISGNTFFSGEMQHIVGTHLVFDIKDKPTKGSQHCKQSPKDREEDHNDRHQSVDFLAKCDLKIPMKRIFLEPRTESTTTATTTTHES
ncbi:uncharacterized protein LOC128958459 [Oppia nitens]|uniref:uncharacterized protein LOC128958459 n=1 Tax=Oppia nitens TaxID=1686743 RepID=UPI0023DB6E24|nr:uncharacterized protein LOC128958459 [Oppia nitens]